jgi:hypothetical protein
MEKQLDTGIPHSSGKVFNKTAISLGFLRVRRFVKGVHGPARDWETTLGYRPTGKAKPAFALPAFEMKTLKTLLAMPTCVGVANQAFLR